MMNMYNVYYRTYYNDKRIYQRSSRLMYDKEPSDVAFEATNFEQLWEFVKSHGVYVPFTLWDFGGRRGRMIECFQFGVPTIRERKPKEFRVRLSISYAVVEHVRLSEVMDYYDGEAAIRWLLDRGMQIPSLSDD